jgi:hypothetical protein
VLSEYFSANKKIHTALPVRSPTTKIDYFLDGYEKVSVGEAWKIEAGNKSSINLQLLRQ